MTARKRRSSSSIGKIESTTAVGASTVFAAASGAGLSPHAWNAMVAMQINPIRFTVTNALSYPKPVGIYATSYGDGRRPCGRAGRSPVFASVVRVRRPTAPPLRARRIRRPAVGGAGHERAALRGEVAGEGSRPAGRDGGLRRPVELRRVRWARRHGD